MQNMQSNTGTWVLVAIGLALGAAFVVANSSNPWQNNSKSNDTPTKEKSSLNVAGEPATIKYNPVWVCRVWKGGVDVTCKIWEDPPKEVVESEQSYGKVWCFKFSESEGAGLKRKFKKELGSICRVQEEDCQKVRKLFEGVHKDILAYFNRSGIKTEVDPKVSNRCTPMTPGEALDKF